MTAYSKLAQLFLKESVSIVGRQRLHQKFLSTATRYQSQNAVKSVFLESELACPQGIQGDEDANLKCWFETCNRYGLENCHDQLQGIQSGRKTLSQVLAEQDALIQQIAERYKAEANKKQYVDDVQGIQDSFKPPSLDTPCPQGVQGKDCAQFKLWLQNCHRFGFQNCTEQLHSTRLGQKTLSDIFEEQDRLIRSVVSQYQQKRSYSTSTRPDDSSSSASTQSSETTDNVKVVKLTQKQRLKKAVAEYGTTVIVFHVCISLLSLGGFYLAVSSGLDIVGFLTNLGVGDSILKSKAVSGASTFVIAYAVHKVFVPVRMGITITCVPFIVRYLRRIGFLKTPKTVTK